MSKGMLGSYNGKTTPNVNMLSIFRQNELSINPNSTLQFSDMVIRKIGIQTDAGTVVQINDREIPIVSGTFELGFGQLDIYSLIFNDSVNANIYYMY